MANVRFLTQQNSSCKYDAIVAHFACQVALEPGTRVYRTPSAPPVVVPRLTPSPQSWNGWTELPPQPPLRRHRPPPRPPRRPSLDGARTPIRRTPSWDLLPSKPYEVLDQSDSIIYSFYPNTKSKLSTIAR